MSQCEPPPYASVVLPRDTGRSELADLNIQSLYQQPINFPTAGTQASPMDGIGRLGHDPPRGPSADWRVLTTADAAGTNGLTLPIPSRTGSLKLQQCLQHFTKEEELDGDEKPTCSKCGVRRKCLKWFTVQKFPQVLVIHLKRFSPTERFRGKLNVLVEFPLTGLDMSPYAATSGGNNSPAPVYNLYAVSNHSGESLYI
ncbi:hypothetical protein evm_003151 [Chilo suppressalis]|nr:hypothetical protein evm_003151 [Chilo suppressalis]